MWKLVIILVEATIEKSVICGVKKKKSFSFLKNKKLRSDFKKIKLSKKIYILGSRAARRI
jgi:hypothetical protein